MTKRVVVAGASSGMGLATANLLASRGHVVYALSRHGHPDDGTVSPRSGRLPDDRLEHVAVDLSEDAAVGNCTASIISDGDLDSVIFVAGVNVPERDLGRLTPASWNRIVSINLSAAYYMVHHTLESLRRSRGSVVFIGSASAVWPNRSGAAYQSSKAGLIALSRAANLEEHRNGVRFSVLSPGLVNTAHLAHRERPPGRELLAASLQPNDIAQICAFLVELPGRVCIPELMVLPTALQAPGLTEVEY